MEDTTAYINKKEQALNLRNRLANIFFCLALIVGMLLIVLEPPFVCPDENAHFINIARMSHGNLFADVQDGKIGSLMSEEELYYLQSQGGRYNGEGSDTYSYWEMNEHNQRPASEVMTFYENKFSTINPLPYALPAITIFGMRTLGFSVNAYQTIFIAKVVNLLFYALIIRLAIKKTGLFPKTMFMLALMPMSIFQGASTSYDASLIACAFLLFAYVTKLLRSDDDETVTKRDIAAITLASAFVVGCKIAYAPLLLILFAIPIKKFGSLKKYFISIGCVAGGILLTTVIPTVINTAITADYAVPLTELDIQQRENFSILRLPIIMFETVKYFKTPWLQSFFGVLGWLDTFFPKHLDTLFLSILFLSIITEAAEIKGINIKTRILSVLGVIIFFVGTIYVMYIEWNPYLVGIVGGNLAYGGQGRYFIPVVLFVAIALCSPLLTIKKLEPVNNKIQALSQKALPIISTVYCALTVLIILLRYWT